MGGCTSTSSIIDDFLDIFKKKENTAPSKNTSLQVPTARSTNYEDIRIPSINTLNRVPNNHFQGSRVNNLDNKNLVVRSDYDLITFDQNYFPRAATVILINQVHLNHNSHIYMFPHETYKCIKIHEYSADYLKIKKMITNKYIIVRSIEEIDNPFLKRSYYLKKEQKYKGFPVFEELQLFHGTKKENIDLICKNNLNWRFYGSGTGHLFGQGISFSCNAMYAATYSSDSDEKVMILLNVLVGKKCVGNRNMILPPNGFDTTLKNATDHIVVVKYEDNEFYPAYKITFTIAPGYTPLNKRQNTVQNRNNFRRARVKHHSFNYDYSD